MRANTFNQNRLGRRLPSGVEVSRRTGRRLPLLALDEPDEVDEVDEATRFFALVRFVAR